MAASSHSSASGGKAMWFDLQDDDMEVVDWNPCSVFPASQGGTGGCVPPALKHSSTLIKEQFTESDEILDWQPSASISSQDTTIAEFLACLRDTADVGDTTASVAGHDGDCEPECTPPSPLGSWYTEGPLGCPLPSSPHQPLFCPVMVSLPNIDFGADDWYSSGMSGEEWEQLRLDWLNALGVFSPEFTVTCMATAIQALFRGFMVREAYQQLGALRAAKGKDFGGLSAACIRRSTWRHRSIGLCRFADLMDDVARRREAWKTRKKKR